MCRMGIVKTMINSVLFRGRNRFPRWIFLLAFTGFLITIIKLSVCSFAPSMCGDYDMNIAKQYGITKDMFEGKMVSELGRGHLLSDGFLMSETAMHRDVLFVR
jgi:hypothetical protein